MSVLMCSDTDTAPRSNIRTWGCQCCFVKFSYSIQQNKQLALLLAASATQPAGIRSCRHLALISSHTSTVGCSECSFQWQLRRRPRQCQHQDQMTGIITWRKHTKLVNGIPEQKINRVQMVNKSGPIQEPRLKEHPIFKSNGCESISFMQILWDLPSKYDLSRKRAVPPQTPSFV